MHKECETCDLKQIDKISSLLQLDTKEEDILKHKVKDYFKTVDMTKTNPEVMGEIWSVVAETIGTDNPYHEVKEYYNKELMNRYDEIKKMIKDSDDSLMTALKTAIAGNLIDFAAKHKFNIKTLMDNLHKIKSDNLAVDDSRKLFDDISKAHTILYLGDNCGEIVLDKIFIEELKEHYNSLKVYYGVRGQAIVNYVTLDDAADVNMSEAAEVISNGDISLGTVLEKTSSEFKRVFDEADVVICKGQGNYEGLINCSRDNVYFLFMAKCNIVADPLSVDTMSIVALNKKQV